MFLYIDQICLAIRYITNFQYPVEWRLLILDLFNVVGLGFHLLLQSSDHSKGDVRCQLIIGFLLASELELALLDHLKF